MSTSKTHVIFMSPECIILAMASVYPFIVPVETRSSMNNGARYLSTWRESPPTKTSLCNYLANFALSPNPERDEHKVVSLSAFVYEGVYKHWCNNGARISLPQRSCIISRYGLPWAKSGKTEKDHGRKGLASRKYGELLSVPLRSVGLW